MAASEELRRWFLERRRSLPWREEPTPYGVWISEVMLQQTQVAVVIPYYLRWMERFPTITALAEAPLEAVIKEWEGLGYYSRARNLHSAARQLVEHHGGMLPEDPALLRAIKGIGPYTVGAIRSFAFHHKAAAVDGNVIRVLSRFFAIEEDIAKAKTVAAIGERAESFLPDKEPWVVAEALIELGATVCKRSPLCAQCPLKKGCAALAKGKERELPFSSKRSTTTQLYRAVPLLHCGGSFLLRRGEEGKVMEGLYEFPYFETDERGLTESQLLSAVKESFSLEPAAFELLEPVAHSFTRYRALLLPALISVREAKSVDRCSWHTLKEAGELPFSSGHRRLFQRLRLFSS